MQRNQLFLNDCLIGLKEIPDNSIDCCVADPPYGIRFMGKKWDYDLPPVEIWNEVFRVLKPGAHALVACGTRTQHRMVCNVEDAGFEVRDVITWHYGSGFPKSLDVAKDIDRIAGARREYKTTGSPVKRIIPGAHQNRTGSWIKDDGRTYTSSVSDPVTDEAKQWDGWGTALKPATEFWTLVRKPLQGTVAQNVLANGVGALNIDSCRIATEDKLGGGSKDSPSFAAGKEGWDRPWMHDAEAVQNRADRVQANVQKAEELGRWPANVILDDFMAEKMDEQSGELTTGAQQPVKRANRDSYSGNMPEYTNYSCEKNSGGASRFYYVAKPSPEERGAYNKHPTVKPLALMTYLIKMVCPVEPGRIVLDPFAGSGTTLIAAGLLGLDFVGYEQDPESHATATRRLRDILGLFYNPAR